MNLSVASSRNSVESRMSKEEEVCLGPVNQNKKFRDSDTARPRYSNNAVNTFPPLALLSLVSLLGSEISKPNYLQERHILFPR